MNTLIIHEIEFKPYKIIIHVKINAKSLPKKLDLQNAMHKLFEKKFIQIFEMI